MNIEKCDGCGKTIESKSPKMGITYRNDGKSIWHYHVDLCEKCAQPFLKALKKRGV